VVVAGPLDGESPVRVWREKRGITQRALAEAANVAVSYLSEIEGGGKQPRSPATLHRIAIVLETPPENQTGVPVAEAGLRAVNRAETAAERLASLAGREGAGRGRLVCDARTIVAEWTQIAGRGGTRNQIGAALQALTLCLRDISSEWRHRSIEMDRHDDAPAAVRTRDGIHSLVVAIDVLREEYRKR
jgi:transcriptional regulator with XRE-family HTH domain